jgi:DNA uptake protein ComE-like DNA-binding protein
MNLTSSARRSEQPLQIGSRHGYRIEADLASINAEISVPPYHPGGAWSLELWASPHAYAGGELHGVKLSEVQFELPTPLAPHTHRVEAQVPAQLPLQGRAHVMLLALVEQWTGRVHDVAQYAELESFPAPRLEGDVGYEVLGAEVVLRAAAIVNARTAGNLSGTLSLELWALPLAAGAASAGGHRLAAAQLAPVAGGEAAYGVQCRAAFSEPPPGRFELCLRLREWTQALGYVTRDQRSFALPYEVASEAMAAPAPVSTLEAPALEPRSVEVAGPEAVLELAPVAEASVAPPVSEEPPSSGPLPRASRAVSIQTGSVEELARVKGLNTKIAKEIIKSRPFDSLDALLKVRGIGRKTLERIRTLVTL